MPASPRASFTLPILMIAVGAGWLLTVQGFGVQIDWVWTLSLAAIGILALVVNGIDKLSIVVGPFFLVASGLSVLRQMEILKVDVEVPVLVITLGVLMLVAQVSAIRQPAWHLPGEAQAESPKKLRL